MRYIKKISLVFAVLGLFVASEAFAQRTGGRIGGRSGFRSTSSSSNLSTPRTSTGSSFFFFPMFGWGFGGVSFIGVLFFMAFLYFFVLRPRISRNDDTYEDEPQYAYSAPAGKPNVFTVDVAVRSTAAKDLQKRLEELGASGDLATPEGLSRLLRETSLALMRRKAEIAGASMQSKEKLPIADAERVFDQQVNKARSRYTVDVVSSEEGKLRKSQAPEDIGKDGILEYLVISFIVAARGNFAMPKEPLQMKTLEDVLSQLGAIPGNQILGVEIVWTPGDPNDSLTSDQLSESFPELMTF